jgi:hypothetical protein
MDLEVIKAYLKVRKNLSGCVTPSYLLPHHSYMPDAPTTELKAAVLGTNVLYK